MQIAFDHQIFALQAYGGISRYFVRLAEALALKGDDVKVIAPFYVNEYLSQLPSHVVQGVKVDKKYSNVLRLSQPLNGLAASLAMRNLKPDLVHETYFSSIGLACRRRPTVLTVYDMVHELYPSEFSRFGAAMHKRKAVERADYIICISECTRRDLVSFFSVDPNKVSVVHLGVDTVRAGMVLTQRGRLSKPYILFVGQRGGYKNFLSLVLAFSLSRSLIASHDLVCFGGGAFTSEELEVFTKLGLPIGIIRHIGGGDIDLADAYANASLFVYPSKYEGFGLPPLEAMSYGCPVVASNTSSIPEVVGNAGEYFHPDSPDDLLVSIERVLSSDTHQASLVARGYDRLKCFTWEDCAAKTRLVYELVTD